MNVDQGAGPRRFHFSDGASHKFWCIVVDERVHTIRFGRIGTEGHVHVKEFATINQARKARRRLIAAKRKKGYVEVAPDAVQSVPFKPCAPRQRDISPATQLALPF